MITFTSNGNFKKTDNYLEKLKGVAKMSNLDQYGREGVEALRAATPVSSSKTAASWSYKIIRRNGRITLAFHNSNIQNGVPIAIILQYGHGTRNGGWVEGRDYINPALKPIFDKIVENAWKEVSGI